MGLTIDHSKLRDMSELTDGQMALVKIKLPNTHQSCWVRCIMVNGEILWHEGGHPLVEQPLGWLAIQET